MKSGSGEVVPKLHIRVEPKQVLNFKPTGIKRSASLPSLSNLLNVPKIHLTEPSKTPDIAAVAPLVQALPVKPEAEDQSLKIIEPQIKELTKKLLADEKFNKAVIPTVPRTASHILKESAEIMSWVPTDKINDALTIVHYKGLFFETMRHAALKSKNLGSFPSHFAQVHDLAELKPDADGVVSLKCFEVTEKSKKTKRSKDSKKTVSLQGATVIIPRCLEVSNEAQAVKDKNAKLAAQELNNIIEAYIKLGAAKVYVYLGRFEDVSRHVSELKDTGNALRKEWHAYQDFSKLPKDKFEVITREMLEGDKDAYKGMSEAEKAAFITAHAKMRNAYQKAEVKMMRLFLEDENIQDAVCGDTKKFFKRKKGQELAKSIAEAAEKQSQKASPDTTPSSSPASMLSSSPSQTHASKTHLVKQVIPVFKALEAGVQEEDATAASGKDDVGPTPVIFAPPVSTAPATVLHKKGTLTFPEAPPGGAVVSPAKLEETQMANQARSQVKPVTPPAETVSVTTGTPPSGERPATPPIDPYSFHAISKAAEIAFNSTDPNAMEKLSLFVSKLRNQSPQPEQKASPTSMLTRSPQALFAGTANANANVPEKVMPVATAKLVSPTKS